MAAITVTIRPGGDVQAVGATGQTLEVRDYTRTEDVDSVQKDSLPVDGQGQPYVSSNFVV